MAALPSVSLLFVIASCSPDNLLRVDVPDRVVPDAILSPAQAPLLVNSVVGAYECANNQFVAAGGLIADELMEGGSHTDMFGYDRRDFSASEPEYQDAHGDCQNTGHLGVYVPISRARWLADTVSAHLESWTDAQVPTRANKIATVAAYAGYSYILLGEMFCAAAVDGGPKLTPNDIFTRAEQRFTRAIDAGTQAGATDIVNMALVGRARAKLNRGDKAGAEADARRVPPAFSRVATNSQASPFRENGVYRRNNRARTLSVEQPYWNLTVGGVPDPRVALTYTGQKTVDGVRPLVLQTKYADIASPIALATGTEAQLIVAEVVGGQTAVDIINAFRARAGLPAFAGGDAATIRAQVIEERRRELFLDGHRLYDLIRLQLPLDPAAGTPFPKGGVYGARLCLPLPDVETNNNFSLPRA
jgi:hypothetical protein